MHKLYKCLGTALLVVILTGTVGAADRGTVDGGKVITFRFGPGNDMFHVPWSGNGQQIEALCALVDGHRAEIAAGTLPVYVDGYCASLPTAEENLAVAFVRSTA